MKNFEQLPTDQNLEPNEKWIDLVEYSAKYGVSQSTLRRRIRAKTIAFKLQRGKYLLKDSEDTLSSAPLFYRSPLSQSLKSAAVTEPASVAVIIEQLQEENKKLRTKVSELETLVSMFESQK